jgi:hypothetical protein
MSAVETDTRTAVTLKITCDACQNAATYAEVSEYYLDSELIEALREGWSSFTTHLGQTWHLCPNCEGCDAVGHSWYEATTDFLGVTAEVIRCRVCAYQCHTPINVRPQEVAHV